MRRGGREGHWDRNNREFAAMYERLKARWHAEDERRIRMLMDINAKLERLVEEEDADCRRWRARWPIGPRQVRALLPLPSRT
jgi:hypothetical protein